MTDQLKTLSEKEKNEIITAPVKVAILIAGADGEIDKREKSTATTFAKFRKDRAPGLLKEFYTEVHNIFEPTMEEFIKQYPSDASYRNQQIHQELERLNPLLEKLDPQFAKSLTQNLREFARAVAEASGGLLHYLSVSKHEKDWLQLDMIKVPE